MNNVVVKGLICSNVYRVTYGVEVHDKVGWSRVPVLHSALVTIRVNLMLHLKKNNNKLAL